MKRSILKYIGFSLAAVWSLSSCEINDPINDLVQTGEKAANVYMEIPVANVSAGAEAGFYTEYWSEDDQYESLELWYSIHAAMKYSLTANYNGYVFALDSAELAREFQKIEAYEHSADNYRKETFSYVIEDAFPISYTLSSSQINNMLEYDQKQIDRFFPASVIESFYVGFFESMDYDLLKGLLVDKQQSVTAEEYETYFDVKEVPDPDNEGSTIEVKVMKEVAVPVLTQLVKDIPLEELIYNPHKMEYFVGYSKSYQLKSKFRVVNGLGVENFSEEKVVTVL
ncbi:MULTISPECIES: hypothetical protein [unclassified Carboxylicivirga]|uniref:hypothetical protein n=1 Tax=Carboxylicivirga TaxID=1628153 RepID=UPI003D3552DC